ncbi:MAG: tetratricopeptide repeat protein [Chloroflexota bacterium]
MKTLLLRVLGAFELIIDEKPFTRFRSNKVRGLLVYLALESGRPHQRRSLAGMLWPEYHDKASTRNLRKALFYMRQAIDKQAPGVSDSLLTVTQQTIQLDPVGLTVDALRLEQLLANVERHSHWSLHTCDECLGWLAEAASHYRDDLLRGFSLPDSAPFEEWLLFKRERLQRQIIRALQSLSSAYEERGELNQAEYYAARFATLDPYSEEAHRQLMRILAMDGRRNASLKVYERLAHTLQTELGVTPEEETQALFGQVLANKELEPARTIIRLHHFPTQFRRFVGRKTELSQLGDLLRDPGCRLLTIIGPGGIGKTRLVIEAAKSAASGDRFVDGIYFVNLDPVETVEALPAALVDALGLVLRGNAASESQLLEFLRTKQCLIVLDNFEHLTRGVQLLASLLAGAPGLVLLVTSRQPLKLRAEWQVRLGGLDYPKHVSESPMADELDSILSYNAIRLFAQSARLVRPGFTVAPDNVVDVACICELVEGMPLALEIASAWTRMVEPKAIVEMIKHHPDSMTSSLQDVPNRHRSMMTVFDHSWSLLTPAEQLTLAKLSIFRGPFSLKSALAVTGAMVSQVAVLLDKSLLQRTTGGRYELHVLLRQYAARKLDGMSKGKDDDLSIRHRHSDYYLKLLVDALPDFYGPQPRLAVSGLQKRLGNVVQAWQWAIDHHEEPERLQAISPSADGLGRFYEFLGLYREGKGIISRAVTRIEASSIEKDLKQAAALTSRLLVWQANFEHRLDQTDTAIQTVEKAFNLGGDDPEAVARVKSLKGKILPDFGQFDLAEACLQEALSYFQKVGDKLSAAQALGRLGISQWRRGNYTQASLTLEKALTRQRELDNKGAMAELNRAIAGIYYEQGKMSQAQQYVLRAQSLYEKVDDAFGMAKTAGNLALLYSSLGQYDLALENNQKEINYNQDMGNRRNVAFTAGNRGSIYLEMGDLEEAQLCFQQAIELLEEVGFGWGVALHQAGLASILHEKGNVDQALSLYEEAIPVLREHGARLYLISPLQKQAEILMEQGLLAEAQELNQESLGLAKALDQKDSIFDAQIQAARLDYTQGDKEHARRQLAKILTGAGDQTQQACLHYELWRMGEGEEHARAAQDLYHQLNEQVPRYTFRRRLNDLGAVLD